MMLNVISHFEQKIRGYASTALPGQTFKFAAAGVPNKRDINEAEKRAEPFMRIDVEISSVEQIQFGDNRSLDRNLGICVVQIFTPLGKGAGPGIMAADHIMNNIRKGPRLAGLEIRSPYIAGRMPETNYYMVVVDIPFQYDIERDIN